jgi:Pyruvate/2-oxoacid:ferredoxin oxidoreductase gamma subunit
LLLLFAPATLPPARADRAVVVVAEADPSYTGKKFADAKPRPEHYIFMQGRYYEGATVDRSLEKMPFRRIAEHLAQELAKQQYLPTSDPAAADLLLVVHWGTTLRHISTQEAMGRTSNTTDTSNSAAGIARQIAEHNERALPGQEEAQLSSVTGFESKGMLDDVDRQLAADALEQAADGVASEMSRRSNVALLGYGSELTRLGRDRWGNDPLERTLRADLESERYFIIVKAYDLKETVPAGRTRRAVWTLHLNMSSPGNNFRTALAQMSATAVNFVGRSTDTVRTVRPHQREGTVKIAPFVILGETK